VAIFSSADARRAVERSFDDAVGLLGELVQVPSLLGEEEPAQLLVEARLRELGFAVESVVPDPVRLAERPDSGIPLTSYEGRRSLVGTIGAGSGRSLVLNGHVDVVSAEPTDRWTKEPFGGEIADGRMYGRGACDMKGGVAAMLLGVEAALSAGPLPGMLVYQSVIEEECGGNGALAAILAGPAADAALIAEPTNGGMDLVAVGVIWARITLEADSRHASNADRGTNPIEAAYPVIQALHGLEAELNAEPEPEVAGLEQPYLLNVGALHSGVANAISQVAQKYGCVYLNTNSSSPTEAGKDCHRVKFVWDGNGTNFALAIVKNAMAVNGKKWVMLTNDYVWGHQTAKAMRTIVEANGGQIVEEMLVPQNTRDFSAYLIKIQQIKPNVVATAVGGDDIKALRQQVVQLKLNKSPAWINNQQDWPDVYGLGPDAIFGVFGTNWYYRLDLPGVKEFVAEYQKAYPGVQIKVPGNVYYNGYMATRELLRAVERAGSTNNIKVIKELEGLKVSARDRMQDFDAYMNPATHQMQQTIYMATYNDAPAEKDDIFKILSKVPPKDVEDPEAQAACKLEAYDATPAYEM